MTGTTLKMVFKLDTGKDFTFAIPKAREDITQEEITALAGKMLDKKFLMPVNGVQVTAFENAYLYTVDKKILTD